MSATNLGALRAAVVRVAPDPAARHPHRVARRTRTDAYHLEFVVSGGCVVEHDRRRATLRSGDFTLCDMSRPVFLSFPGSATTCLMTLVVPRELAARSSPAIGRMTGVPMSGQHGTGALVSSVLTRLARDLDHYDPAEGVRISTAVLDLVGAALTGPAGFSMVADRHESLRREIYAH